MRSILVYSARMVQTAKGGGRCCWRRWAVWIGSAALIGSVDGRGAAWAQGRAGAERGFERALGELARDWFEARPPTRFADWDPARRGELEERARALGELPRGLRERAVEILFEAAVQASPKQRSRSRFEAQTPFGPAVAHWDAPRNPAGFLLGLHGGGEGVGDANEAKGNWTVKGMAAAFPQAVRLDGDAWNTVHGERFALTLMEHAKLHANVDPDRIYVAGFSMGGTGAWHLAGRFPDWFAGAIPAHGVIMASPRAQLASEAEVRALQHGLLPNVRNLAVYAYTGLEDRNCMPGTYLAARTRIEALKAADPGGYQGVRFTFHERLAHAFPPGEPKRGLDEVLAIPRNTFPTTVVWEYASEPFPERRADDPVGRMVQRQFYWLRVPDPVDNMQIRATRTGNTVELEVKNHPRGEAAVEVLLHPDMIPPDQEVVVTSRGRELYRGTPAATVHTLITTFDDKLDARMVFERAILLPQAP